MTPTLEGCRDPLANDSLVCDGNYVTGNLGKKWNELDLVPHRLTTKLGNQDGATTAYNVYIAADYKLSGFLGYDVITVPVKNASLSHASCTVAPVGPQQTGPGVTGGADETIYRELAITQNKGTTCVFDWQQRLALGASKYSGSSLQSYTFDQINLSGGKRTVPLPVGAILPQEMAKTMSATRNAAVTWNLIKSADPGSLDFGDVCKAPAGPMEKAVNVTVTWTKSAVTASGDMLVTTNINVKNPASRQITVSVTDTIYKGATKAGGQFTGVLPQSKTAPVAAGFNGLFATFSYTVPAQTGANVGDTVNDEAVATYTDTVTNVEVPGNVTAVAKAVVQLGSTDAETANIADTEDITGAGLQFKVAAPLVGAFNGYTAGNLATQVKWDVMGLTGSGSVVFNKTVVLDQRRITSGELTDTATLVTTDSQFTTSASLIPVTIKSSAKVKATITKKIPLLLVGDEKIVVNFMITRKDGTGTPTPVEVVFKAGDSTVSVTTPDLEPADYTITEGSSVYFADANSAGAPINLQPVGANSQDLFLSPKAGGIMDDTNCAGTVFFENRVPQDEFPIAKVRKDTNPKLLSTDPDYLWEFTLSGPPNFVSETISTVNADNAFVAFVSKLTEEGTYTITETLKSSWDLTGIVQPDGSASTKVCTFVVNFPDAFKKTFECSFTNTKRGFVKVAKSLSGGPLNGAQFTFQLRQNASNISEGNVLETLKTNADNPGTVNDNVSTLTFGTALVPGQTYQMCEAISVGWSVTFTDPADPLFVPNSFTAPGTLPNPNVDNSWLCINFTVAAGQVRTLAVNNTPPPGGNALTIGYWKNHASCTTSSTSKEPALDNRLWNDGNPMGILLGSKIDSAVFVEVPATKFGLYGQFEFKTADCPYAVKLLDKRDFNGNKKASDPLFNMVAQLVAAELNIGKAYQCLGAFQAISAAEALLAKYSFTGFGYSPKLSSADAGLANKLATKLDDYNNNRKATACAPL